MAALDDKIVEWQQLDAKLTELKAREVELRAEIFAEAFAAPTEGVNVYPLGAGWVLKGTHKINRSLDARAWLDHVKSLPADLARSLVDYKPILSVSGWKAAPDHVRLRLADCVTEKPGLPSLELCPPKETKP